MRWALLAFVLASCPGLPHARAQGPAEPDPSREEFEAGVRLLREGRYAEAAEAFRASYRSSPRVATMCNLALTYDRWGPEHRARAVRAYRTCARDDESGRFRGYAERRVREIERELALLEVEPPTSESESASDSESESESASASASASEPESESESESESASASASESESVPVEPLVERPAPDYSLIYAFGVAGALTVGAVVAGVVLALDAQAIVDALRMELGPSPRLVRGSPEHARFEDARQRATAAAALYVVAGIAGAAALTFGTIHIVLDAQGASLALVPLGPGVALRGAF